MLEELGYLEQPHTSAGRIPTVQAYRMYVDKLMPKRKLSRSELKIIKQYFGEKLTEIDDILKNTAKVISEITNLTGVAVIPNVTNAEIQDIKIIKISPATALVIIVTDKGVLKDGVIETAEDFTEEYYYNASKFISSAFKGYSFKDLKNIDRTVKEIKNEYKKLFDVIFKMIKNYAKEGMSSDVVLEGSAKLLDQPEYSKIEKAKAMLEFIETKEHLMPMVKSQNQLENVKFNVRIGKANDSDSSPECAIVTANYSINGIDIGNAGVIGPIRMDYSKVVSVLDYIGKTIEVLPQKNNSEEDL